MLDKTIQMWYDWTAVMNRTAHGQALELTSRTMPITSGVMDSTYRETSRLSSGSEPVARGPAQGRISLAHCAVLWTRLTAG